MPSNVNRREIMKMGIAAAAVAGVPSAFADEKLSPQALEESVTKVLEWCIQVVEVGCGRSLPSGIRDDYVFSDDHYKGAFKTQIDTGKLKENKDFLFLGGLCMKYGRLLAILAGNSTITLEHAQIATGVLKHDMLGLCKPKDGRLEGGFCEFELVYELKRAAG